jgi:ubiquitin-like-conjugating enzyme ATG3
MTSFIPNLVSRFQSAREYMTPVLTTSQFYEKGQLTPEEFVNAGEYLIRMSPTWKWGRGDATRAKAYLPPDKQFLILSSAPCRRRVATVSEARHDHDIISMLASEVIPGIPVSSACGSDDEYGDISHFAEPDLHVESAPDKKSHISAVDRNYEITIVYDNYYRTPRVYLCGYSNEGRPLSSIETMEDIMQDYINKTATIEAHPHIGLNYVSIHPCRHSETMKRILDVMIAATNEQPPVQMYMFLFIKFIGSMIPTIEYDNTIPISIH